MIAVDTNVIAYLWIPGEFTALAEQVLLKDPEWIAPLVWRSEFRNVLAEYVRREIVALDAAMQILAQAETHMRGGERAATSADVLRSAVRSRCSAYDCEFVVVAEQAGTPLVTNDKRLLAAFPAVAVSLEAFAET